MIKQFTPEEEKRLEEKFDKIEKDILKIKAKHCNDCLHSHFNKSQCQSLNCNYRQKLDKLYFDYKYL